MGIAAPISSTDLNQARSSGAIKDTAAIIAAGTPLAVSFPPIPLLVAYEAAGRGCLSPKQQMRRRLLWTPPRTGSIDKHASWFLRRFTAVAYFWRPTFA